MKKFLGILAIAGVLVACDNSGSESTTSDTTTIVQPDTMSVVTDTTTTISTDTIGQGVGNNPVDTTTR